jgi:hypothetical protein
LISIPKGSFLYMPSPTVHHTTGAHYIQHVRIGRFIDFLLKLPFQSVFGWSDDYCKKICNAISIGNHKNILSVLHTAKIQTIENIQIGNYLDSGGIGVVFKATLKDDNVIMKLYDPFYNDAQEENNGMNTTQYKRTADSDDNLIRASSMYEAMIGIIMHSLFAKMEFVSAPRIYKYGYVNAEVSPTNAADLKYHMDEYGCTRHPTIVMSPLEGIDISTFTNAPKLEKFLLKTAHVLEELQRTYRFSHRDLHTGNIRYIPESDSKPDSIEIFDFGESCFKWPDSPNALQLPKSDFYSIQDENVNECNNQSFDLAMLVLSCYNERFGSDYVNGVANQIFNEIKGPTDTIKATSWTKMHERYDLTLEYCKPMIFIQNFQNIDKKRKNNDKNQPNKSGPKTDAVKKKDKSPNALQQRLDKWQAKRTKRLATARLASLASEPANSTPNARRSVRVPKRWVKATTPSKKPKYSDGKQQLRKPTIDQKKPTESNIDERIAEINAHIKQLQIWREEEKDKKWNGGVLGGKFNQIQKQIKELKQAKKNLEKKELEHTTNTTKTV